MSEHISYLPHKIKFSISPIWSDTKCFIKKVISTPRAALNVIRVWSRLVKHKNNSISSKIAQRIVFQINYCYIRIIINGLHGLYKNIRWTKFLTKKNRSSWFRPPKYFLSSFRWIEKFMFFVGCNCKQIKSIRPKTACHFFFLYFSPSVYIDFQAKFLSVDRVTCEMRR